ncbi:septum formation initiator family protein, partial [Rhizobium leguminosarum]|uniref:septum formation initiator family protein n=1 Tax=Rhizobium leguminosarum TaxID=384 RepID=UPI003F9C72A1
KKRKIGRFVIPAMTVAFLSYFGYHCIHGEDGLRATETCERQRVAREKERAVLKTKREHLEKQVALLSDGSRDKDMW